LTFEIVDKMARHYAPLEVSVPTDLPEPLMAAKVTRTAFGLSPDLPITHLVRTLEKHGVYVLALPIEVPGHDAFSTWMDSNPRRPVIVITQTDAGDRLRFSVAHELGHLVLHRSPKGLARIENEANSFAAEFLVPADAVRSEMNLPLTLTALASLKARWGVSMQTLVTRARDVGIITESQRRYLFQQISARGWRKKEPVAVPLETPRLLRKLAETLHGLEFEPAQVASHVGAPARLVHEILDVHFGKKDLVSGPLSPYQRTSARDGEVISFTSPKRNDQG
jgi:Zn-dependent peptidase ImmA (M78 family)